MRPKIRSGLIEIAKQGSVIDLSVELEAHGVIGCVRPVGTPLSTRPAKNISRVVCGTSRAFTSRRYLGKAAPDCR